MHLLENRDPTAVLRATPGQLTDMLRPVSQDAIDHKPGPGKWSIREILCHMADCEVAWAWRLRILYGSPNDHTGPLLQTFEQDSWARAYDGSCYTTATARATWSALRQWNLALIEGLSETDKQKPGSHPELGPVTLWNIVEIAAGHDLHHLAGLEKLLRSTSAM